MKISVTRTYTDLELQERILTVVDRATITNEAIDKLVEKTKDETLNYTNTTLDKEEIEKIFTLLENDGRYNMISKAMHTENYMVTPKEIDDKVDKIVEIIASGINVAV